MKSLIVNCQLWMVFFVWSAPGSEARGPLRIHPANARYFTAGEKLSDGSLKAIYLTGAHTWNNLVDMGRSDPPERFDFAGYLDFMEKRHHNFIRLWAWDSTLWDTRANGSLGKDFIHNVAPLPWVRTGPELALDGKPKFDLTRFDPVYFERLRARVSEAGKRGIYVSVMLFEGWGLFHGNRGRQSGDGWAWRAHPFNPSNNINGIRPKQSEALSGRVHTRSDPAVNDVQAAYIRKVVDTLNDLDNVLYEVINEGGEKEWDWWVVQMIRDHQRTKPKQHVIGITGHGAERLRDMLASPADWISPGRADGYADDPPAWNESKVSVLDTDHIWGVGGNVPWVWKSFLRGHNPIFMDPYDGSVLGKPAESAQWDAIRRALGHTRRWAERMNLAAMTPHPKLSSTGYCLANPGKEYLVYQPASGAAFKVQTEAGAYQYQWTMIDKNESGPTGKIQSTGDAQEFKPSFDRPALLYLSLAR